MLDKPSFKNLITKGKRCIVFLNGFYEWRTENKIKQPYYVYLKSSDTKNSSTSSDSDEPLSTDIKKEYSLASNLTEIALTIPKGHNPNLRQGESIDDTMMMMAGLYDEWEDVNGQIKRTYTTLTCPSCTGFQWLHSRQPVLLSEKDIDAWLDPKVRLLSQKHLLIYILQFISHFDAFLVAGCPFK